MTDNDRALSFLSICQRAGCISHGEFQCENSISRGKARLLIIAEDASENTVKKFMNLASGRKTEVVRFGTKEILGRRIGKDQRSVITVNDRKMGQKLSEYIVSSDER